MRFNYHLILVFISVSVIYPQQPLNIAIIDLEGKNVPQTEASILTDKLRVELYKTGMFQIIERGEMNEILMEQGFQQTGCFSDECIVEVGKLIGVEQIIAGSIGKVGSIYFLSIRIIDITEGIIVKNVEEMVDGTINEVLITGIPNIALKLTTVDTPEIITQVSVGTLSIVTQPTNAVLVIDGEMIPSRTPTNINNLSAGEHLVNISLPGFKSVSKTVMITPAETYFLKIELEKVLEPQQSKSDYRLKNAIKVNYSILTGTMEDYDKWVDVINEYVVTPDTVLHDNQKLDPFGFQSIFQIQYTYSLSDKFEVGLIIGRILGDNHYVAQNNSKTRGWEHKFQLGTNVESLAIYYKLIPSSSRYTGVIGLGLDYYQSTLDFKDNTDFGRDEIKSTLSTTGFGSHFNLGFGYGFTSRLGIDLNIKYRIATLSGYSGKVKYYSYGNLQTEEDAILFENYGNYYPAPKSWLDGPGTRNEGSVDMTGLEMSAGLVFGF